MFGYRQVGNLARIIRAGIDLIEFSMDAADYETYALLRPPRSGKPGNSEQWWAKHVNNVRTALSLRKQFVTTNRIVVSIIRQQALEGRVDEAVQFWLNEVGVDEVITRKFLSWDDNTTIDLKKSVDLIFPSLPTKKKSRVCGRSNDSTWIRLGELLYAGRTFPLRLPRYFRMQTRSRLRKFGKVNSSPGTGKCI
jgi:hypothetical protein